ncbi:MAG: DUF5050 domain-containing protein [Phycisphaerales bacterium]
MKKAYVVLFCSVMFLIFIPATNAVEYVFFSNQGNSISRSALDGSGCQTILYDRDSYCPYVGELAVDSIHQSLYYVGEWKIKKCNFNGSNPQTLFSTQNEPGGLAIGGNKMYWTEVEKICRANLDGSSREDVITNLGNCFSLTYDNVHNKLYYVGYEDLGWTKGAIFRADPDGKNIERLIDNIGLSVGLAIDPYSSKIYWASRSNSYNSIKSSNLDGTGIIDLITGQQNPLIECVDHLDIDLVRHKLYWTDQGSPGGVQRMNTDGTGYEVIYYSGSPYGIAVFIPEPGTICLFGVAGLIMRKRMKSEE